MNRTERLIVQDFKMGTDTINIAIAWSLSFAEVEDILRKALKAQDKKKGTA